MTPALRDCGTFELVLPLPQASMTVIGFHARQVCVTRGLEVRRTHDLAALAQTLSRH